MFVKAKITIVLVWCQGKKKIETKSEAKGESLKLLFDCFPEVFDPKF